MLTPVELECVSPPLAAALEIQRIQLSVNTTLDAESGALIPSIPVAFLFDGSRSPAIRLNADAVAVTTALESLSELEVVDVSSTVSISIDGLTQSTTFTWDVTFRYSVDVSDLCRSSLIGMDLTHLNDVWASLETDILSSSCVQVTVIGNQQHVADGTLTFKVVDYPQVVSLSLTSGPVHGGSLVHVYGKRFVSWGDTYCVFGDIETVATFVSDGEVTCLSPPRSSLASVFVQLISRRLDNPDLVLKSESFATFSFHTDPKITDFSPSHAQWDTASIIRITGVGFRETKRLSCRFNVSFDSLDRTETVIVLSRFRHQGELECALPNVASVFQVDISTIANSAAIHTTVEVSNNGVDFVSSLRTFFLEPPLLIKSIAPATGPSTTVASVTPRRGPVTGSTTVIIALSTTSDFPSVYCKFGNTVVEGTISSATVVQCSTPPSQTADTVSLLLGANGVDFDIPAGNFVFEEQAIANFALQPEHGFTTGGTLVLISGPKFDPLLKYSCMFADVVVSAEFVNQTHVGCRTPPATAANAVAVRLSSNAQDFSFVSSSFAYEDPLYVSKISPVSGDIDGGEDVNVHGGIFSRRAYSCRFGDTVVEASIISPRQLLCRSPPLQLVSEVQQIQVTSQALIPDIQRLTIKADPVAPTIQRVRLTRNNRREVQQLLVYGDRIFEVQEIRAVARSYSGELYTVQTTAVPVVREVQAVRIRASSYVGGSFRFVLEGRESAILPSYASAAQVESALEALDNVGVVNVAKTVLDSSESCYWTIEFATRVGDIPAIEVRNLTLKDSGTNDLQVEVIELVRGVGAPLSGSFRLVFDGMQTDPIVYDASADAVASALQRLRIPDVNVAVTRRGPFLNVGFQWQVSFDGIPTRVRTLSGNSTMLAPGTGALNISLISGGAKSEVQELSTTATSGTFVCKLSTQSSDPIPYDSTADVVAASLQRSGFGKVAVSGKTGGPWQITFLEWSGNLLLMDCGSRQSIREVAAGTGAALTGTIQLGFVGGWTSAVNLGASATEFAKALNFLPGIGAVDVSVVGRDCNGGNVWRVTFTGLDGDVPLLGCDGSALLGLSPQVTATEIVRGNSVSGLLRVGWTNQTSSWFSVDDASNSIQQALSAIESLGVVTTVDVNFSQRGDNNTWSWDVTFPTASSTVRSPQPMMTVAVRNLTGSGIVSGFTRLQQGVRNPLQVLSIYGALSLPRVKFTVGWNGRTASQILYSDATASNLQDALNTIDGLGRVLVERTSSTKGVGFSWALSLLPELSDIEVTLEKSVARMLYQYQITFPFGYQSHDLIKVLPNSLRGSGLSVSTARLRRGIGLGGDKVTVEVSSNGQDYSSSGVVYQYAPRPGINRLIPSHGPLNGGTEVIVGGVNFLNSSSARCRFGDIVVPVGIVLNSTHVTCISPRGETAGPVSVAFSNYGLAQDGATFTEGSVMFVYDPIVEIFDVNPPLGPTTGNFSVMVSGSYFPQTDELRCKFDAVTVNALWRSFDEIFCIAPPHVAGVFHLDVSLNGQDFPDTGFAFIYHVEQGVHRISPVFGPATVGGTEVMVEGKGFVNSSYLACRFGFQVTPGEFVSSTRMKCITPPLPVFSGDLQPVPLSEHRNIQPDPFTGSVYLFPDSHYYPQYLSRLVTVEVSNNRQDFTLTGVNFLYYDDAQLLSVYPTRVYDIPDIPLFLVGRNFINSTYLACRVGLRVFNATFVTPNMALCRISNNGRDFTSSHAMIEFRGPCPTGSYCPAEMQGVNVICPRGAFCPGEGNVNYTLCPRGTYQPKLGQPACFRCPVGYHCPEESEMPTTVRRRAAPSLPAQIGSRRSGCWNNETADFGLQLSAMPSRFWMELKQLPLAPDTVFAPIRGRFCLDDACARLPDEDNLVIEDEMFDYSSTQFALRRPIPCPAGVYCHPGTAGSDLTMKNFSQPQPCFESMYCPEGSSSPRGFGDCDPGSYCPFGTRIPCPAGTFCPKEGLIAPIACPPGVVSDEVRSGDYRYPQNCTEGFYCELGSFSPKGSGLCPPGFTCPAGTAVPIPTEPGTYTDLEGTVSAAQCAPGYYAPTIESTTCIPCPPGTTCENDGMAVASICPPGSYRGSLTADGISCIACPQGTWSKNWELRGLEECIKCPPGSVCPIDGITYPCTIQDLPHIYKPLREKLSFSECLEKGSAYFYGVLLEPWIDDLGQGPHFLPSLSAESKCYENMQPLGSVLYQRLVDYHGPLYELVEGVPHQGYGDINQIPAPNVFERGSLAIDIHESQMYHVGRNCTKGFFHYGEWFPGTCEADLVCYTKAAAGEEIVAQAQPCPEGYVCDQETTAYTVFSHPCPGGYVCGPGTTPDVSLEAPQGQFAQLCPASRYCPEGTAESQKERNVCPQGYFCPTGTANPYIGAMANDSMIRRLTADEANPFLDMNFTKYIADGDIRLVSAHDMRCFNGINDDLLRLFRYRGDDQGHKAIINQAIKNDLRCSRDHKWRLVDLAMRRNECDCVSQVEIVLKVFQLWKCTSQKSQPPVTVYDQTLYGWQRGYNTDPACRVRNETTGAFVNLGTQNSTEGVQFQTSWVETETFHTYEALKEMVVEAYRTQATDIDPYLFDLNHAISVIELFGEETPEFVNFVPGTQQILRLDTCGCSRLLKCPNGTTSAIGSDSIYDCVKTSSEILQRTVPIPLNHSRLLNGTDNTALSGTGQGIGSVELEPLEVAIFTINTTQLSRNITYKDHYQISIYMDCQPCPPRYKCNLKDIPPSCTYPNADISTPDRLYAQCMDEINDDHVCKRMPFWCTRRDLLIELADGTNETESVAGCCSCERREMPIFFEDTTQNLGYPDNKHGYIQFSVSAVERTTITVVIELLHGLYVRDFVEGFTQDRFDFEVFTPSRADYAPGLPSTNSFIAVMQKDTYTDLMLPLNLPETKHRIMGKLAYEMRIEEKLFTDRLSDIMVGDPQLPAKHNFIRNSAQNSFGGSVVANSTVNITSGLPVISPEEFFGLDMISDPVDTVINSDVWWAQRLGGDFIAVPYLPFFSSCREYDSHIWIPKLLESHPDCVLINYDQTIEVNQYPWNKKLKPNADSCLITYIVGENSTSKDVQPVQMQRGIDLHCTYEENLEGGAEKPRWYEARTGTTLFHLSRDPWSADEFVGQPQATPPSTWGENAWVQSMLGTDKLVAVKVGLNPGLELAVPQAVYLNLSYYQVTQGRKRLVEAEVNFDKLCTTSRSTDILAKMAKKKIYPCAINKATQKLASTEYVLQVSWEPLTWFALMNMFQFTVDVYLGFFTLVGILSITEGMIIWIINRLFTKMKKPPKFRMKILLKNMSTPPSIGMLLAFVPTVVPLGFTYIWWNVITNGDPLNNPSSISFEGTPGDWLDQTSLDLTRVANYKQSRVGMSLVAIGMFLLRLGSHLLIPDTMDTQQEDNAYREMSGEEKDPFAVEEEKEEEEEKNEFWDPLTWKRANFTVTTLLFLAFLLVIWEFSYSSMFTNNIYAFLAAFKVMRFLLEIGIESVLYEKLLAIPFMVVLSSTESMIAMGSADFIGFTLFYFVNLSFTIIERLYFAPLVRHLSGLWPKWRLMIKRKFRKRRRRTREQKALEEAEWRQVCEKVENQESGVESVLEGFMGYSVVCTDLFMAPFLLAFQVIFGTATKMPELYGVGSTDLLYYSLYSLFIIPSNLIMGVFLLNTMELAHGWKVYEFVAYQKHRFATREHRWQIRHASKDESIHPSFQTIDLLCFSSQYYFLIAVYALGILFTMFGASVFLRYNYNVFGDCVAPVIMVVMFYLNTGVQNVCIVLADKLGIWMQKRLEGTLDDELAAKLALGAGRQKDLERERLELQALNSERFRHRFLERNRPWLLQHLVELFTPRTLEAAGKDGRPNSEYVRDIYHELMNMGEGRRLQGDRSDISDDDEDDLEKMRRNWSNVPVDGASKDLALYWLARARKRRTFTKLIAGILANSKQASCFACQKNEEGGYTMHVDLAGEDGAQDKNGIDRLIYGFEEEYGEQEMDPDLWKAYFRKNASFVTLCNVCISALEQKRLARIVKQPVASKVLRAGDLSSDEEIDVDFEPIIVARTSVEGRVLSKWLLASRKRLGGVFPRENAQREMEAYAKKMRERKARKGKKAHVDSDEEDPSLHWKLQLNEASRALALKWIWQARDAKYAVFCEQAAALRTNLKAMCDKMQEVDDWFYGRELRLDGLKFMEEGEELRQEQIKHDEDMRNKIAVTERDIETFEKEKREAIATEQLAFQQILLRDSADSKQQLERRERELLELQKKKEVEFAEIQRNAKEDGSLTSMLVNEHRSYLTSMEEERTTELKKLEETLTEKERQKKEAFDRKLALSESAIQNRKALAQHRILSIKKEAMNVLRIREKSWQSRTNGWMDKAGRKIAVKEQEDLEAKANEKKRRKRVLLAS
ncbi:TPA: hypothetical protein N0F65_006375 [Lagenidium giganteum]|uniref:IPT/TIG domain-containing protein n=1 Tax=Lagenidium giganteum TaxID=4803 RepID=A0AAV2YUZ9_9STRA|nr:TPA: hypothetical protein N0F65_006375 [Lagenidium giganteum]